MAKLEGGKRLTILITCFGPWFDDSTFWTRPLGGIQSTAYLLCRGLRELGVDCWVIPDGNNDIMMSIDKAEKEYSSKVDGIIHIHYYSEKYRSLLKDDGKEVMWLHLNGQEFDSDLVMQNCRKIICLSEFQKSCLDPKMHEKVEIWPYLYVPELFGGIKAQFGSKRLIYASHPQKGLTQLLEMLPELVPILRREDAILSLVTGEEIWFPENKGIGELEDKLKGYEDVIDFVGAVPMPQLPQEMAKSSILAYPCFSDESFCLIALFAQAVGLPTVTSDFGALPETAKGQILIYPENAGASGPGAMTDGYKKKFVKNIEMLLTNKEEWAKYHEVGLANPLLESCDYRKTAKRFLDLF